ncbi:MAG: MFS transporter [Promethearchaeota archaeon]
MSKINKKIFKADKENEVRILTGPQNLIYNLPSLGLQIQFALMGTFILSYYIIILGAPPIIIGGIYSVFILLGGLMCPIWGAMCDKFSTRFGRKKTFMLYSAPIVMISFILIWMPPIPHTEYGVANISVILWFIIIMFLFTSMSSAFNTTYLSMIPELSTDEDNRIKISIVNMLTMIFGAAIGMLIPIIFLGAVTKNLERENPDLYYPNSSIGQQIYIYTIIAGILIAIFFFISFACMMLLIEEPDIEINKSDSLKKIFKEMIDPIKDKNYRNFLISFSLLFISATIFQVLILNFATFVIELRGYEFLLLGCIALLSAIISFIIFDSLSKKYGLKKAMMTCLGIGSIAFSMSILFLIPMTHVFYLILGIIFISLCIVAFVGTMIYPLAIVSNIIDTAQERTNKNLSGSYMGTFTMSTSLATALGVFFTAFFLQILGEKSDFSYIFIFFIAGVLIFFSMIIFNKVIIRVSKK